GSVLVECAVGGPRGVGALTMAGAMAGTVDCVYRDDARDIHDRLRLRPDRSGNIGPGRIWPRTEEGTLASTDAIRAGFVGMYGCLLEGLQIAWLFGDLARAASSAGNGELFCDLCRLAVLD